jgi:hypothetical protein
MGKDTEVLRMTELILFSPSELDGKRQLFQDTRDYVASLQLETEADLAEANETLKLLKSEVKAIEEMRTSATKPMNEALTTVRSWFKPLESLCAEVEKLLKDKIAAKTLELRKKAEEDTKKLLAACDQSDYNTLSTLVTTAATDPKLAGTSVREVWTAVIVNPDLVPREWCIPDEKKIGALARATKVDVTPTPIAGVNFVKKAQVSTRT